MSRVAANQSRAQEMRRQYVYTQKQTLRLVRSNGKIAREERREYLVTPGENQVRKHLVSFQGKYESKGRFTSYTEPEYHYKNVDIDADLINSLSEDLTNDQNSKDGISCDLFPLTGEGAIEIHVPSDRCGVEVSRARCVPCGLSNPGANTVRTTRHPGKARRSSIARSTSRW